MRPALFIVLLFTSTFVSAQLKWELADSLYGGLPGSVHVYHTTDRVDTAAFRAFYLVADLKDKKLQFSTDTTNGRRLTPSQFYEKNGQPLAVVNGTFFSFETNRNLNLVVNKGKLLAHNRETFAGRGKDTFTYRHVFPAAIGITTKRTADVVWTFTDSAISQPLAMQYPVSPVKDSLQQWNYRKAVLETSAREAKGAVLRTWKVETAIGGGPVLLQNGDIAVSNNEEMRFGGKGIQDKHPRTAMGYTADNKLIILVVEGRNPNAGGATLVQEAQILKDLGCVEALNLDGGGSSCLLVNGKETIRVSDKTQRAVPAVFIISTAKNN
jgi:hypothetical protein